MKRIVLAIGLWCGWAATAFGQSSGSSWMEKQVPELFELYQHFHQHPELSLKEEATGQRLAEELRGAGCEVQGSFGGHGVVGVLSNGRGPRIMFRSDLDALPVTEETNLVYASKVQVRDDSGRMTGVMHACGHDMHITCMVGLARWMAGHKDRWSGTALFIGQPAEERGDGAKAMLEEGLFEKFGKPDFAVALHVDAQLATGKVGYLAGYTHANVDSVDITVRGRGGHGAVPENAIDPVVIAARLILDLQTIASREIKPGEPIVVTVGSIHGGTKHNIIGDECHLELTVRTYTDEVRTQVLEAIGRKAKAAALASKAPEPMVKVSESTPGVLNDPDLVERLVPAFRRAVGAENVTAAKPTMGGEDFSRYGRAGVPICMFRLGSVDPKRMERFRQLGQMAPSLHSALYYPDAEAAIRTGVTTLAECAQELMPARADSGPGE